jgi:hypothetical protein
MAFAPNEPIGLQKDYLAGCWVHDANATDKTCTNTNGDYWFQNTIRRLLMECFMVQLKVLQIKPIFEAWGAV